LLQYEGKHHRLLSLRARLDLKVAVVLSAGAHICRLGLGAGGNKKSKQTSHPAECAVWATESSSESSDHSPDQYIGRDHPLE
jgi:hypothetical protein